MAKEVKCKYCKKLKNHWCKAVLDSPDEDLTRECHHFVHKTHADRIRAMSDEEFSCFLTLVENGKTGKTTFDDTSDYWLKWLKQPVEDDDG